MDYLVNVSANAPNKFANVPIQGFKNYKGVCWIFWFDGGGGRRPRVRIKWDDDHKATIHLLALKQC